MSDWSNGVVRLYQGDARQVLRELPADSVQCVVTSPPYWGLRDYGLEPLVWGGDEMHVHAWGEPIGGKSQSGSLNGSRLDGAPPGDERRPERSSAFCPCAAWRGSLGLEPTIELYVRHLVEVFRDVRRVLRKDGTLWLNMGDSYAGSGRGMEASGAQGKAGAKQQTNAGSLLDFHDKRVAAGVIGRHWAAPPPGLKSKDLCMMPARVALALQADGWWLRSDVVWSKPNPMPESVTDRPTRSHEYLFLLTKAERYYYDADAIREPNEVETIDRFKYDFGYPKAWNSEHSPLTGGEGGFNLNGLGRNKRSVWEIATEPYPEAHFATFPQKLVEPCILAGCPVEGMVLDPFSGSGTVAYVAQRLGRRAIGIDLNADYLALAARRLEGLAFPMDMGL